MKKTSKKMSLSRETLKTLNPKNLGNVAAGVTTVATEPTSDLTYHCTPYPGSQARLCY